MAFAKIVIKIKRIAMIIIGHELVTFKRPKICDFSKQNLEQKSQFILIKNEIQAVIANANGINFLACESLELAKSLQELANDYLFDSKIALLISNDNELLKAITARIDAVIYKNIL